jgi:hypothetical protein
VAPERLDRWIAGFAERHGATAHTVTISDGILRLRAVDMAEAELFPPPGARRAVDRDGFVAAAAAPRRIGLLLARKAAVAVGIAVIGDAMASHLEAHKVDSHYVQSRTAAGGWSQQRFARRRENQAKAAAEGAAEIVLRLLGPEVDRLATMITGGDRRTVDAILADRRLAPVAALRSDRFLAVPEPRLSVLEGAMTDARAVRIRLLDPPAR